VNHLPALPAVLRKPGLFITGTDTGVGKTVSTCGIAWALRKQNPGIRVGVCKPFATGCRHDRSGLVSQDAEAIAHFSDTGLNLETVNPIRFVPPMAPGPAAQAEGLPVDYQLLCRALEEIDAAHDVVLIEGVGGIMVPLDPDNPHMTVLHFARALGYPVLVVARAGLGTLNHTAMTCRLLSLAGLRLAGLVVNNYIPDVAAHTDPSMSSNLQWLQEMNNTELLAVSPLVPEEQVRPDRGVISDDVLHSFLQTDWLSICRPAQHQGT
jgi:dethiobiotin synthetase